MKRYCIEFEIFEGQGGQLVKEGDDGQVFSNLYPFRESFYERLGYVTFPLPRIAKPAPSALLPLMEKDLGGQVELMLIGDGFDIYREYPGKLRQRTHGMATTALVYGTHDPDDFAIRGWGNPSPAVQAIMRAMFQPMTPYLHEYF